MTIRNGLFENKGTVVRLIFHGRSGNLFKFNPLIYNVAGFLRGLKPTNDLLDFESSLSNFPENNIIFVDAYAKQTHLLQLELSEIIIGITSLVLYPDGSTWEGLLGTDFTKVRAMIWSPELAEKIKSPSFDLPWKPDLDWKSVPTALLVTSDDYHLMCPRIEHTCGEQCK